MIHETHAKAAAPGGPPFLQTFRLRRMKTRPGPSFLVDDDVGESRRRGIAHDDAGDVHPFLSKALQDQSPVGVGADLGGDARIQTEPARAEASGPANQSESERNRRWLRSMKRPPMWRVNK